jgi:hypothetical protein
LWSLCGKRRGVINISPKKGKIERIVMTGPKNIKTFAWVCSPNHVSIVIDEITYKVMYQPKIP